MIGGNNEKKIGVQRPYLPCCLQGNDTSHVAPPCVLFQPLSWIGTGALSERLLKFDARSNPLGTTGGLGPGLLNVKSASLYSCNFSKE